MYFADFHLNIVVADFVGKYFGGVMNCLYTILYMLLKLWFIIANIATYTYTLDEEMASGAPWVAVLSNREEHVSIVFACMYALDCIVNV